MLFFIKLTPLPIKFIPFPIKLPIGFLIRVRGLCL